MKIFNRISIKPPQNSPEFLKCIQSFKSTPLHRDVLDAYDKIARREENCLKVFVPAHTPVSETNQRFIPMRVPWKQAQSYITSLSEEQAFSRLKITYPNEPETKQIELLQRAGFYGDSSYPANIAVSLGTLPPIPIKLEFKNNPQLVTAAEKGNFEAVKKMLEYGADPNMRNNYGATPLSWAAEKGHTEMVKVLLEAGADPNMKNGNGSTPLGWAVYCGHTDSVKVLLEYGADPNIRDATGNTPLVWATHYGRTDSVKVLLEYGADPNMKNENDSTPLELAAEKEKKDENFQSNIHKTTAELP